MDLAAQRDLVEALIPVIRKAGEVVRSLQQSGATVSVKQDGSPVTYADLASHDILRSGCLALSSTIAVFSEEDRIPATSDPSGIALVIDPLDGTKEFVQGRDDFAINIALVDDGRAAAGLIYAPARERLFFSYGPGAVFEETARGRRRNLSELALAQRPSIALVSRSHLDSQTEALLAILKPCCVRQLGSSLKFAAIATAEADFYPRLSPTMIWDCAAGQAIIDAAGGLVLKVDGSPLRYPHGQAPKINGFVAVRTPELGAHVLDAIQKLNPALLEATNGPTCRTLLSEAAQHSDSPSPA
jgi:3'(2'), 5'-bisphosphate nucleotidase